MKCTQCSKPVRPVVAIDIDGTLGDYHGHFRRFAEGFFGRKLPVEFDGSVEFHEALGVPLATYRDAKLAYRQGGLKRNMPVDPLAAAMVAEIRKHAEVFITTTRPFLRLDQTDPDTREWLKRNGIGFDGLLYDEHKYEVLAQIVDPSRVVAVLDDLAIQYDAAARIYGPGVPILRATVYNSGTKRPNSAPSLGDALDEIRTRIRSWKDSHVNERQVANV